MPEVMDPPNCQPSRPNQLLPGDFGVIYREPGSILARCFWSYLGHVQVGSYLFWSLRVCLIEALQKPYIP